MRWSEIDFRPKDRMLRQFALLWIVFFGAIGAFQLGVRGRPGVGLTLIAVALLVGGLGLAVPGWIRPIYTSWMVAAFPIGWLVSHAMLGLIYYGLFTPLAIGFRLLGRDPLRRRRKPEGETYYLPKLTPTDPATYFQQY